MKNVLFTLIALGLVFASACSQQSGSEAEPATIQDMENAAQEAGDAIEDTAEDVAEDVDEVVEDTQDGM